MGLSLMLLTQFLDNWGDALCQSVINNVGGLFAFQLGPDDSKRLSNTLTPFSSDVVENLDLHEAIVKMRLDGRTLPAFDMRTLPIQRPSQPSVLAQIREQTRRRFARPRSVVEAQLASHYQAQGHTTSAYDVDED